MNKHLIWAGLLAAAVGGCDGSIDTSPSGDDPLVSANNSQEIRHYGRLRRDAGRPRVETDAGPDPIVSLDAGLPAPAPVDSGTPAIDSGAPAPTDSGVPTPTTPDSGPPAPTPVDAGAPSGCVGAGCTCVDATRLWYDDFETGDYSRWTGRSYGNSWGDACQSNAISTVHPRAGRYSNRSEIVCSSSSPDGTHRGYGGLQWSGDTVLSSYTNSGTGLSAPNGIVTTFWTWLEVPYAFGSGRWMSLFTINPTCDYTQRVVTLGLDQPDGIMRAAHYWPEGTQTISPGAPRFPMGRWVRVTVYMNLEDGTMHVWQDGQSVLHVTGIVRASHAMCQWHWGLYASADNTDVVMYEDDKVVWRMDEPWTDFSREPYLGETQAVCP